MIRFCIYGGQQQCKLDDLLAGQQEHGMFWANAENSGSESCYCEVARWNDSNCRWERYCFVQCMDYRLPNLPDATDIETALAIAKLINDPVSIAHPAIIHRMPDYSAEVGVA